MLSNIIKIRVRYSETDQMSFVYHGNYAQYFEMGRTEWLRELGVTYKNMEESGIMLPVISLNINFMKPAKYDDLLSLKTTLVKKPSARIAKKLVKEIINEPKKLIKTPHIGQVEELLKQRKIEYRYLVFKNYKLIYSVDMEKGFIKIADVFDTRQNPPKLKRTK